MFTYYLDLAPRSLRRNRILATLMIVTDALGIGASMTMISVLHVLSGDPHAMADCDAHGESPAQVACRASNVPSFMATRAV